MILNIAYGYTPKDCDDPLVILADECMSATIAAGGPGAVLCDMVPARTFPDVVVGAPLRTFLCSETLAHLGSFLRIQEACAVYQVHRGKVLQRTVSMGEGSNGESQRYCRSMGVDRLRRRREQQRNA